MTHRLNNLSRRNMFALTAGGASALAVGRLLGGTAHAAPAVTPLSEAQLPQALPIVPGDLQLDPSAEALAQKLLARMKKSVLDVTTRPGAVAKTDKVAAAAKKLVGSLKAKRLSRVESSFKATSPKYKEVAEWSKAEPRDAHKMYDFELSEFVVKIKKKKKLKVPKEEAKKWQPPLAQKIEFHLNSVKCKRVTSGWGTDEILLGGSIITPGGVVKKIDAWKVGEGFDDDVGLFYDYSKCKDFPANTPKFIIDAACPRGNPDDIYAGRKIAFTRLNIDIPWPATIGLILTMGEQDSGGFNQMVQDAYAAVRDELQKKLAELGVEAGEAIGGEFGAEIGAVIGKVLGSFLDWLVSLFNTEDDFIATQQWTVRLDSPEMSAIRSHASGGLPAPAGIVASQMKKLTFVGDGGKYETRLHWRIYG